MLDNTIQSPALEPWDEGYTELTIDQATSDDLKQFISNTEAATEFIPHGEPVPYDAGSAGLEINQTVLVPENGANGLVIPPVFESLARDYGKKLDKAEVNRIITAFTTEISVPTQIEIELDALDAVPKDDLTDEQIKRGGEIRKLYKNERVQTEHTRKFLGEQALRTTQLINGCANAKKARCEVNEAKAGEIERVKEIRAKAAREKLAEERLGELALFLDDSPLTFDLGWMPEDQYQVLRTGMEAKYNDRLREAIRLENEKSERDEKERVEREAAEKRLARVNQLSSLGFQWRPELNAYSFENLRVESGSLSYGDDGWFDLVDGLTGKVGDINDAKAEAERLERENARKRADRVNRLVSLGIPRNGGGFGFEGIHISDEEVAELDADGGRWFEEKYSAFAAAVDATKQQAAIDKENARIAQQQLDELNRQKAEEAARAKAEEGRVAAEARAAEMAPDKEKLLAFVARLEEVELPTVNTVPATDALEQFWAVYRHAVLELTGAAESL